MIKLGVSGACGKMGRRIIALARQAGGIEIKSGFEYPGCPEINNIVDGVKIVSDLENLKTCDCFVEFSTPQATLEHLKYPVKFKIPAVIGTTGIPDGDTALIEDAAKVIPVVFSPNMSIGVNIFFKIVKLAAEHLSQYGYAADIAEAHHVHKKDAPSGTAKKIASIVNGCGFKITDNSIKSIREDEIVGDHKIAFTSDVDSIELFHSAKTRDIFVKGAIAAVKWVMGKPPGLYSMEDVLFSDKGV